ncbi:hypothetical protein BDV12DRAFT_187833 [Aspergillus spectabilis]
MSVVPPGSQHSPSAQGQRPVAQQPPRSQPLADPLNQLRSISSSSNYQAAEEILNEAASLRSQLQPKEKKLEQVRNEMSKQVTAKQIAINGIKEATSKIESLNKLVQAGKDAITRKERVISDSEGRYKKLQSAHTQLQSDLKRAQQDIDGPQHQVKEKDVLINKNKISYSENQERLKAVEERAKEMEMEKSALNKPLQAIKARLDKIEGYATQHSDCDEDSIADAFINLWQYATTEIYSHLNNDLSEGILQNRSIWDTFKRQSNLAVEHHVQLPHSNSPAAKQMRLAIFLAILAREVDKHIFQPTYIAQNAALQSRIQAVIRNVSSYLYGMLLDGQFSQLRASVGKIVEKPVGVWHPVQRSLQRYEPDFEPLKWGDDQWSSLDFPEGSHAGSGASPNMLDESLLTVFPRITVVEKGHRFPLTYVVQLRRSQPQCLTVGREVSNVPTSTVIGRVASNWSRRKSNASSNAGHENGTLLSKKSLRVLS